MILSRIKKFFADNNAKRIEKYNKSVREDAARLVKIREVTIYGKKSPCITINGMIAVVSDKENLTETLLRIREYYYNTYKYDPENFIL